MQMFVVSLPARLHRPSTAPSKQCRVPSTALASVRLVELLSLSVCHYPYACAVGIGDSIVLT